MGLMELAANSSPGSYEWGPILGRGALLQAHSLQTDRPHLATPSHRYAFQFRFPVIVCHCQTYTLFLCAGFVETSCQSLPPMVIDLDVVQ